MKKKTTVNGFGHRLAYYRKAKGLTQQALGESFGVSNRNIAYYEGETDYPPAHLSVPLATALGITTDKLLASSRPKMISTRTMPLYGESSRSSRNFPKKIKEQSSIKHYIMMVAQSREIFRKTESSYTR
ncbi:MAG: helix-turn-helix transcriptional regulator [Deltaproteobacteria bacterium]|nr:helix-turn-helix transcriptional regulator [Deltaproteobacteria bacterium]